MEGELASGSVGTFFFCWDPDTEILIGPENVSARGPAERSNMEGLADKECGKGNPVVIDLVGPAVEPSSRPVTCEDSAGDGVGHGAKGLRKGGDSVVVSKAAG